ncbi:acyl carrier protein [Actinomyces naeslundii]|uniref:acyl carrier protein n=1 Tax=Actinomyces naeslundii TaxID=1655 RepID=UPI00096CEBCC|nr:acyl carrier protein [Actinomyces naeslundii]OMG19728.1 acyl carrier protein [Actinomyces naeslundii]OMG24648.1 acyl carrier protein [Actinomyces naeslundii]OMG30699.1 acyl carrier protein [Actinomyces naeslundii]OMG34865.1 acyl carrier protein [Actinomyces naeslundii]OMG40972.1 acyl carrier protein [Actinomyces naeslundii]
MAEQSNEDVLSVITQIVSEESGVDAEKITPSTTFTQDLDVDSLGLLTIATQVEERFGVALDDSLIPTLPTVGALVDLVASKKD